MVSLVGALRNDWRLLPSVQGSVKSVFYSELPSLSKKGEVITMYLTLQDFVILITMIVTIIAFVVDVCNKKR